MANQEHLDILKQGVKAWNQWRETHPDILPDLNNADLQDVNFNWAELYSGDSDHDGIDWNNLDGVNLRRADLTEANLKGVNLSHAKLSEAKLIGADLSWTNLRGAHLENANLEGAHLENANLRGAVLRRANLSWAEFWQTDLSWADLREADLTFAGVSSVIFADVNLSTVKGLETVQQDGPSTIGIDTIIRSKSKIPEIFLRKAGVPQSIIEAIPALVGSLKPIDFYSCFISYSSRDQDFAERLYADLLAKGVRCWFAPEDMKTGDKIRYRVDESIRLYDKLVIVLSQYSVASLWVEHEVETALGKELEGIPNVIYPIRLDEAVMDSREGWASHIRLIRHITDFTQWKEHDHYQKAFDRLLRDLKSEAQKMASQDNATNGG